MHRSTLIAAAAGILLAPTAANAQQASFDCMQAVHPIEWLICSDPVLMRLDGALGEAYAAHQDSLTADEARQALLREQRAWLQRRLTKCGIPTSGDRLSLLQRWQAAPCLAQMYSDRLSLHLAMASLRRLLSNLRRSSRQRTSFIPSVWSWRWVSRPARMTRPT
jgi:uncharacterized protein YecT (DUF1311 family)